MLAFTGGVGEHDDADVSAGDDPVRTVVVTAREDVGSLTRRVR